MISKAPVRSAITPIALQDVQAARARIASTALRTPLVRLHVDAPCEIWLKLEMLQPIGSFKIRGALNAMRALPPEGLAEGVYTASAGNMAQGLAWAARELGVPCRVVAPDHAPRTKLEAIERLGATVRLVPFAEWWRAILEHEVAGERGAFIHPGADPMVMAGNGTIGLEILEDLPETDAILVPYGSGGLACGIACAVRAVRPGIPVYASELEGRAPFAASLAAGHPVTIDYTANFVDGMGGKSVLDEVWPLAREVLAGSVAASLRQVADAVKLLVERARVVAEGAGAAPVAAALANDIHARKVVCVVSGGNIDTKKLAIILSGEIP
jgi:threonine dehydratase